MATETNKCSGSGWLPILNFPRSVAELWQSRSNIPALVRLAKHYCVTGGERWQRSTSEDTDRTEYNELDVAAASHLERCLMVLAAMWGLQYQLERPRLKQTVELDDEPEVRRARARRTTGTEVLDSIISKDVSGELTRRDQIICVGPR
ncbi:hypothetical protein CDV55_101792 [Aspergillus turcosus]|uniref:Uncharacterized protein n=1 Tax=Aspergillus turcosus TaxID=1245748 RepID=A0A229WYH3_9EURO|nr:hypothetical protein CDV55_101792 [Aspergillus turcosus]RLL95209.1 hypothetical protein CFD26_104128 [Aspergillus turcosus]